MTDGPSASASALANKIAFQALLPGASKMSERVFRGKQASWHVEFIGKLVSLDQAKLDAGGGDATLADKAWLWLTKAKRGELIMPATEGHSSLMVLAATAVSGGEQADEEKTVRARDEEAQGESRGRVKKQKNILVKGEPTDSDTEEVKYVLRLCAIRAAKFGSTLRISNNFSMFSSAEIQKSEMSMLSLETIVKDALTDIQDHQCFCQVHGIKMKKGEMFDVEQPNDMKIGGAQGSLCCVVEKGIRPEELLSHFQPWDVATSSFSEDTGLMFRCANLLVALDSAPIPDQLDFTIHVQDHFTRAKAGQDTTLARRHAGTLEKVELSVSKDLFFSTRYSVYALFIQELHRSHRKRLGDDDDAEYYLQGDGSNIVVLGESASACKVVHHSSEVKKLGGFQTALRTKV